MRNRLKDSCILFMTFFKIGLFTFGGGYAMISLIQKEVVDTKHWITDDDILDIIAIAESTPGPIAINASTFVGYKTSGFWGAFFATLGVVLPSFAIITVISYFLEQFEHFEPVKFAFNGIRAGILVLIIKALMSMYKKSPKSIISYIIMAFAFAATAVFGFNVLAALVICSCVGLISYNAVYGRNNE